MKSIGRDWRKYKSTLKKKLFNPKKKRSALYKLCPDNIDEDQWKGIVKYWKSAKGKVGKVHCHLWYSLFSIIYDLIFVNLLNSRTVVRIIK